MLKLLSRELLISACADFLLSSVGQIMTAATFAAIGVWLASQTPILALYEPYSYYLCFLLTLLVMGGLLLVIKELRSGTKGRTYIEYEVVNGQFVARTCSNIHRVQGLGVEGNKAIILAVFKKRIKHPNIIITDATGVSPSIKGSFPDGRCGVAVIEAGGQNGRIWLDFNAKINT